MQTSTKDLGGSSRGVAATAAGGAGAAAGEAAALEDERKPSVASSKSADMRPETKVGVLRLPVHHFPSGRHWHWRLFVLSCANGCKPLSMPPGDHPSLDLLYMAYVIHLPSFVLQFKGAFPMA